MQTRRHLLRYGATGAVSLLGGCVELGLNDENATLDLIVLNRSSVEQTVAVSVKSDDEVVFEESYSLPAPDGGVPSVTEDDVLKAGQYTVRATSGTVERESQYRSTCEDVKDVKDKIYVTLRSDANLEISSTYCGR